MNNNIFNKKINILNNEGIVLNFLYSKGIKEVGNILSPKKEVWLKHWHYIEIIEVRYPYKLVYHYIIESKKYEGEILEEITFEQLKEYLN